MPPIVTQQCVTEVDAYGTKKKLSKGVSFTQKQRYLNTYPPGMKITFQFPSAFSTFTQ